MVVVSLGNSSLSVKIITINEIRYVMQSVLGGGAGPRGRHPVRSGDHLNRREWYLTVSQGPWHYRTCIGLLISGGRPQRKVEWSQEMNMELRNGPPKLLLFAFLARVLRLACRAPAASIHSYYVEKAVVAQ